VGGGGGGAGALASGGLSLGLNLTWPRNRGVRARRGVAVVEAASEAVSSVVASPVVPSLSWAISASPVVPSDRGFPDPGGR